MNVYEKILSRAVIVNHGSGVIVQPMTSEYTYILTAKHNLPTDNATIRDHLWREIPNGRILRHPDASVDCAIIILPKQTELSFTRYNGPSVPPRTVAVTVGFPTNRRNKSDVDDRFKLQDGTTSPSIRGKCVFTSEVHLDIDSVEGFSGGGLYVLSADGLDAHLLGVQAAMDETTEPGRSKCFDLTWFDSMLQSHTLPPLAPSFLQCFSRLNEQSFNFNVWEEKNVEELRIELHKLASELVASGIPAPHTILEKHHADLLVNGESEQTLFDEDLWIAYIEFLIICAIIDNTNLIDNNYLEHIEKTRRFVYLSKTDNWLRHYRAILETGKRLIGNMGTIIVASRGSSNDAIPPNSFLEANNFVDNICQPVGDQLGRIDSGIGGDSSALRVAHLGGLHSTCVVQKETIYRSPQAEQILQIFRREYNAIIKW
ncbi:MULTISPECIES: ABC-three component system protein [unclassified Pseudomonas]|uniref:ABC-three component system protein n=1 Tax=unclassified Pseudomonas TaxID=196821 RepID=UPI0011AF7C6A|nr:MULTISPECIES: ABC-three component system protein [unclassified Pseudomonas]